MLKVRDFKKIEIPLAAKFDVGNLPKTLDVEIGCGVGWHAIEYAKNNPERCLVAIEKTSNKFEKFNQRFTNHPQIKNLKPVHANAVNWIATHLKPECVDRYFILYPNPNPKDPQKRWFRMPFMRFLLETLKPGGTVTLATNIFEYYKEAKQYNIEVWGLILCEDRTILPNEKPRTHFEKKYLAAGQTCYNLVFQKVGPYFGECDE